MVGAYLTVYCCNSLEGDVVRLVCMRVWGWGGWWWWWWWCVCVCVCVLIVYCWYTTDKGDYPEKCKSFVLINGVLLNLLCVWIWYTIGSGVFRVCCVFWLVLAEDERLSDNTLPLH